MQAGIAIGNNKPCGQSGKGHQPIRVSEPNVRGTRPNFPLVAHDVLDGSQAELIFTGIGSFRPFIFIFGCFIRSGRFGIQFLRF
jgi:hypothetical protein